ncbi:copper amine oxidase [Aspergillus alliaceus]|uniref:copper amine oxidase n=1 Tax=Petromyces alliaceus TaxID=209559 RepID=UPI0012A6F826|nr:copper amine oxidase [Aspergillus alliaceus]KAB8231698.1 copper amine oxidase [Aspergillus alliaceus]
MTVPYGDPRSPYHRKQAFDLGDLGFGITSNTLTLCCDCLGLIAYPEGARGSGSGVSMVRNRLLVIQCTATVLNYEYILAFVLEQVANLHIYFKATGIVSIDHAHPPKTLSLWGIVVALCVLAVSHQHLFYLRIDPALDGVQNTVIYDDIKSVMDDPQLDLLGVVFRVHTTPIT